MISRMYCLIFPLSEVVVRASGYLMGIVSPGYKYELERRLRGGFFGIFHGLQKVSIDRDVLFDGSNISLSSKVKLYRSVQIIVGSIGYFRIGEGSHIAPNSIVCSLGRVEIGRNCNISSNVRIYSATHNPDGSISKSMVRVGDSVLIGSGAYIRPGVSIGNGATVGSGAVVVKDVPAKTIVVGVPAIPLVSSTSPRETKN